VLHVYDADHWRRLAQEARARAEKITDADARREMRAVMAQRVGYLWIIGSDVAQHTRCASAIDVIGSSALRCAHQNMDESSRAAKRFSPCARNRMWPTTPESRLRRSARHAAPSPQSGLRAYVARGTWRVLPIERHDRSHQRRHHPCNPRHNAYMALFLILHRRASFFSTAHCGRRHRCRRYRTYTVDFLFGQHCPGDARSLISQCYRSSFARLRANSCVTQGYFSGWARAKTANAPRSGRAAGIGRLAWRWGLAAASRRSNPRATRCRSRPQSRARNDRSIRNRRDYDTRTEHADAGNGREPLAVVILAMLREKPLLDGANLSLAGGDLRNKCRQAGARILGDAGIVLIGNN